MLWNPWRGCHRYSDGCKFCYIHKGDKKRNIDTNDIVKSKDFYKPILKDKKGNYKVKSNTLVYMCFCSDFLIAEADCWRIECYEMIKARPDVTFLFLTKRIDRFMKILPDDWQDGYDNVIVGVSVENMNAVKERLTIFNDLPIKHKNIILQPLIEAVDISAYLKGIELVVVGGESDRNGRLLDYNWVLAIKEQCLKQNVSFEFRQCATNFVKDEKHYYLQTKSLRSQAKKAAINHYF